MDKIPFREQRVIDELVVFWQTGNKPRDLGIHIDPYKISIGVSFFRQVYEDLQNNERNKYSALTISEFKQFLEAEYCQRVEEREGYERKARADFDDLGKKMEKTTIREELVELGRKRAILAAQTGASYSYESHCWQCNKHISSLIHAQCPICEFYICVCGACLCGFVPL